MLILQVLSDLEPFRITWDYKQRKRKKVKDKKNPKSKKIMALLSKSNEFRIWNGCCSCNRWCFIQITHIEFGFMEFNVDNRLVVEALIFALSAFEPWIMS
jgi:hypothetical protein